MKLSIIISVFLRDFRKQKKRIALTLLALGWGTISIMLLLGFGEGLQKQMTLNNKGMGENITILWGGRTLIPYKGMGKGRRIHFLPEDAEYLKKRVPEIDLIGGEYSSWGIKLKYGDHIFTNHVVGCTPEYESMRNFIPQNGGRMINALDMKDKRRVAFIGLKLKEKLYGDEDAVGKQVFVNSMPFTVVGVMIDKLQNNSYGGMDEDVFVMPATTFKAMFGNQYLDNIVYRPKNVSENRLVFEKINEALAAKYKFDPNDDEALSDWDTIEGSREFNNIMLGIKIFMGIIGGLTLLIAGVGVSNIMYVSIKERTREIGIKMAMGARKSFIMTQFLLEAMLITFSGGFGGMAISYIMTESFKRIPIDSQVLTFLGRPTISLEIGLIVITILSVMGIFSGLFPAIKAASVNPVESLRYE